MKLTPEMLTTAGFIGVRLGEEEVADLMQNKTSKQYYVAISGGGWRALSGHMGTFRELGITDSLSKVLFFSSVSGGSWFLHKLSFDEDFAEKVLIDNLPIGEVVSEWFEDEYFPAMQQVEQNQTPRDGSEDDFVKGSVAEMLSQAPDVVKQSLGNVILVADGFDLSWQEVVEQSVLGKDIANKTLATAELARITRAKFGKEFILSSNWNQLHEWEDNTTQWFLKKTIGQEGQGQHVQYPLYVSAQYERLKNGDIKVGVRAKGKSIAELVTVCKQRKGDVHFQETSYANSGTTNLAILVNAALGVKDTVYNFAIAAAVAQIAVFVFFCLLGLNLGMSYKFYISIAVFVLYNGRLRVHDELIQSVPVIVTTSALCWLVTAFMLYCRHKTNSKMVCNHIMWYLFIATLTVPVEAAAAVFGAATVGGRGTAIVTGAAAFGLQGLKMMDKLISVDELNFIISLLCISVHVIVGVIVDPIVKTLAVVITVWVSIMLSWLITRESYDSYLAKVEENSFLAKAIEYSGVVGRHGPIICISAIIIIDAGFVTVVLVCMIFALALGYFNVLSWRTLETVAMWAEDCGLPCGVVSVACILAYGIVSDGFLKELLWTISTLVVFCVVVWNSESDEPKKKKENSESDEPKKKKDSYYH